MDNSPETPRVEHENAMDMLLSVVARLNVQHELIADWIHRLNRVDSEDPVLMGVIVDMKARNVLLRKADAKPEFFTFFDNYREAEPDLPFAQCVSEALKKFNELEATRPRAVASYAGRKRPFRPGDSRESGLVHQLSQQVYAI
ncbi:hypothetical protein QR680_013325 [Steinernema hermaphroditum]|uniref:Uncharacterized protein n=1 Tax=Steinernema hermaphroditum TaxID=289476 RepID=A0AA39I553_9BILA|nr:hypothetical protein QR680_013325 [Steinernema hermaphroditum]